MTLCFYSEAPISENTREKNAILRRGSGNVGLAGQSQPVGMQDLDLAGKVTSTREPEKALGWCVGVSGPCEVDTQDRLMFRVQD